VWFIVRTRFYGDLTASGQPHFPWRRVAKSALAQAAVVLFPLPQGTAAQSSGPLSLEFGPRKILISTKYAVGQDSTANPRMLQEEYAVRVRKFLNR
jgi:hypothetical protein